MTNEHQRRMPGGFTMIEVLGALLIMTIMMPGLAWLWQKGAIELRKRAVAEHFATVTRAVERGINDAEIVRHAVHQVTVDGLGQYVFKKRLVNVRADDLYQAAVQRALTVDAPDSGENVGGLHLFRDYAGVVRRKLRAVRPVDLVAVVLF